MIKTYRLKPFIRSLVAIVVIAGGGISSEIFPNLTFKPSQDRSFEISDNYNDVFVHKEFHAKISPQYSEQEVYINGLSLIDGNMEFFNNVYLSLNNTSINRGIYECKNITSDVNWLFVNGADLVLDKSAQFNVYGTLSCYGAGSINIKDSADSENGSKITVEGCLNLAAVNDLSKFQGEAKVVDGASVIFPMFINEGKKVTYGKNVWHLIFEDGAKLKFYTKRYKFSNGENNAISIEASADVLEYDALKDSNGRKLSIEDQTGISITGKPIIEPIFCKLNLIDCVQLMDPECFFSDYTLYLPNRYIDPKISGINSIPFNIISNDTIEVQEDTLVCLYANLENTKLLTMAKNSQIRVFDTTHFGRSISMINSNKGIIVISDNALLQINSEFINKDDAEIYLNGNAQYYQDESNINITGRFINKDNSKMYINNENTMVVDGLIENYSTIISNSYIDPSKYYLTYTLINQAGRIDNHNYYELNFGALDVYGIFNNYKTFVNRSLISLLGNIENRGVIKFEHWPYILEGYTNKMELNDDLEWKNVEIFYSGPYSVGIQILGTDAQIENNGTIDFSKVRDLSKFVNFAYCIECIKDGTDDCDHYSFGKFNNYGEIILPDNVFSKSGDFPIIVHNGSVLKYNKKYPYIEKNRVVIKEKDKYDINSIGFTYVDSNYKTIMNPKVIGIDNNVTLNEIISDPMINLKGVTLSLNEIHGNNFVVESNCYINLNLEIPAGKTITIKGKCEVYGDISGKGTIIVEKGATFNTFGKVIGVRVHNKGSMVL